MRILIAGSTGVLGRNVIPRLIEKEMKVRALVRTKEQQEYFNSIGTEAVIGDILDIESLKRASGDCQAAMHLATAIPSRHGKQDWQMNDRIRREGTENLLKICKEAGISKYFQQSIIFLYGDNGDKVIDESTPLRPASYIQSAADMEKMVMESSLDWYMLRGGSFYGPGTGREEDWIDQARERKLAIPGDGKSYISLIHAADMARAFIYALENAKPGSVYNVVDDQPVEIRELYSYICTIAKAPMPHSDSKERLNSIRCSNHKLKDETEWKPAYTGYRSGLAEYLLRK